MIRSMTGFASLTRDDERAAIGVTVRSVNHRYLDIQMRVPQHLSSIEPQLRGLVQRAVSRGRVELAVSVQSRQLGAPDVELNEELVRRLADAFARARSLGLVEGALLPGDLMRVPQALVIREPAGETVTAAAAELGPVIEAAVGAALADLGEMRAAEGRHMKGDLDQRAARLGQLLERISAAADEGRAALVERLGTRVRELAADFEADPAAIAQEIVRVAARSDISEEVTRFRAHLAQWGALVEGDEPCGRKLDFLLQELNREVNTIGAKADGAGVPELIIDVKAELEKMREQVQNVE